jgi:hypothetical protein
MKAILGIIIILLLIAGCKQSVVEEPDEISEKSFCSEEDPQSCGREFSPVCGWANENIQCIKYPCAQNYPNKCTACADEKVEYWTPGQCPN